MFSAHRTGANAPEGGRVSDLAKGNGVGTPQSRSDPMMVAVAFKPRFNSQASSRRVATVESRTAVNRRSATQISAALNRGLKATATFKASLRDAEELPRTLNTYIAEAIQLAENEELMIIVQRSKP